MDNYDTPWKAAITSHFDEFMAFYFPAAHAAIDWSVAPSFLDQELAEFSRVARVGRRRLDKLIRVVPLNGSPQLVYIHIEVQGWPDHEFSERLFSYHYRLYDRFRCPIASLVILADGSPAWRPCEFRYELFDCSLSLRFPIVKLVDYRRQMGALLRSRNVFAFVTVATLMARETRRKPGCRFAIKILLASLLYERGWDAQRVITTMRVLDWMMALPDELQRSFERQINYLEGEKKMPYMDSWWRRGVAEGLASGIERGLEQGLERGHVAGLKQALEGLLRARFGNVPEDAESRIAEASPEQLGQWCVAVLSARRLEDVFMS